MIALNAKYIETAKGLDSSYENAVFRPNRKFKLVIVNCEGVWIFPFFFLSNEKYDRSAVCTQNFLSL